MRILLLSAGLFFMVGASTASAQTEYSNRAIQRSENRRALRDARKYKAEYKDSHLDVSKEELRQGGSPAVSQPNDGRDSYKFDHTGAAYVREPIHLSLRPAGKRKKPANE
ncbi:hypothetical protein SAMN02745146_3102 [Hymenobacter daecheongensis DSM 21074]|uniref:Uncharacterized protein n=1 Tax=Hymenobacter daecheongensis DSM 21074 TaxID=1121955 RepID=A0A1M6J5A7_9BACT|nr:hypothetical protein [Hymenobacter daecheongensis]SHJ41832.1 hypothetical protein SAMN02745146_3102 [Hymenobacter daecheongensis DSM 21074]